MDLSEKKLSDHEPRNILVYSVIIKKLTKIRIKFYKTNNNSKRKKKRLGTYPENIYWQNSMIINYAISSLVELVAKMASGSSPNNNKKLIQLTNKR